MYNIKVSDFIRIKENKTTFDVDDLVHICKRRNNTKREYLFVNRYQGKHVPEKPSNILKLYKEFYNEIRKNLNSQDRILVVGFAETATALAEFVSNSLLNDLEFKNSFVYHLQTSRENLNIKKLFNFSEEHSHAVNQSLYCKGELPAFNRVLFIEDEITTGKTILNFIENFSEINVDCNYSVASILNWQDNSAISFYENLGIQRICLVSGNIRNELPTLSNVIANNPVEYMNFKEDKEISSIDIHCKYEDSRVGVKPARFNNISKYVFAVDNNSELRNFIRETDKIMLIGTEEFMYIPFEYAVYLEEFYGYNVLYRATTRSPIDVSGEEGYILKDSIMLPSAYDSERTTFLYNMIGDYNKIIVITDSECNSCFKNALSSFALKNNKQIKFVKIS